MRDHRVFRIYWVFIAVLTCSFAVVAQSTTSLRGIITDPTGALIPGAVVSLANVGTGFKRQVLTSEDGVYQFLQAPPGTYQVIVEKSGFATVTRDNIQLLVNTPAKVDLQMEVGGTSDVVNVAAEATAINTVDASVGNPFSEQQVRQLPLGTRNVVELLSLQVGVTPTGEVLGARRDQNNITLDGADVNNNQNSGLIAQSTGTSTGGYQGSNANGAQTNAGFNAVLPIPLDSVQEFRVTVGGAGASAGRSSGGQVALVTKSGTNQLHGSAYEYNRNTVTAANTWFNNKAGVPVQPLIRNQFGASAGGKIVRDRAFYFFNYEQRIDASGVSQARIIPSDSLRQGFLKFQLDDGSIQTLTPAEVKLVDPLNIGVNPNMTNFMSQYPSGNDPAYGQDGGLNFSGFRFNAPSHRNDRAIVGKLDFHLDAAGKHTVTVRGTLAHNTDDVILAQFPGQNPASTLHDKSKGFAAQYTSIPTQNMVNVFSIGYTRFSQGTSGVAGPVLFMNPLDSVQNFNARATSQRLPTWNPADDLTWTKGKHTITTGLNFRFIRNNTSLFTSSFPRYGFGATELIGLGADIQNALTDYIQRRTGNSSAQLADPTSAAYGMAVLLGLVNDDFHTDQFDKKGNPLPQGTPQSRSFIERDYGAYVGDSYRATRELTVNMGVRYENFRPIYEANGIQVAPTVSLNDYFATRNYLQSQGVPQNAMPNAILNWDLNGPVNGKPGWWKPSNLNFAPRIGLAYGPQNRTGILGKVFGKSGALRAGAGMVYDRFGSDLVAQYDQYGSIGLATATNFADSYSFSTSPRFTGQPPELPANAQQPFPYTPPPIAAIAGDFLGISSDLKPPYSYVLNASLEREIPGSMVFEIGYTGRLSHRLLLQGDVYTPLEYFKDPKSGITWEQNNAQVRALYDAGVTVAAVQKNPKLVPALPFVENLWPGLKDVGFPGSASANYFQCVYGDYNGSYLDCLHALDRNTTSSYFAGECLTVTGCYTFFPIQGSSMPTWMNAGQAAFHGMTVSLRRPFSHGVSFDFNYTWSHSIDNGSSAESGAGKQGAAIQNVFNAKEFRGSSDFDIRHNISANYLFELPIGKNKPLFRNAGRLLDGIIGGWQISSVMRYRTGLPTTVAGNLAYNANYWLSSLAISTQPVKTKVTFDQNGNPSIFGHTNATEFFADELPGHSGTRAPVRLAPFFNTDLTLQKTFKLPKEGQRIHFRAEAFNAFNTVNFTNPSLALTAPLTFGEFQQTTPPREMQFALRYEF
jgi:Carboxypeptidase regulatory-like domain